jgi:hypothetical protein
MSSDSDFDPVEHYLVDLSEEELDGVDAILPAPLALPPPEIIAPLPPFEGDMLLDWDEDDDDPEEENHADDEADSDMDGDDFDELDIEEEEPLEEDPESDIEHPPTPEPTGVHLDVTGWSTWDGPVWYAPGTMIYVRIAPAIRCYWKARGEPYYLGPLAIIEQLQDQRYLLNVPARFRKNVGNSVPRHMLQKHPPLDRQRIIDPRGNLNFFDVDNYTDTPFKIEDRRQVDPWDPDSWCYKVYWRCYGIVEATLEREYLLRCDYPSLFL